MKPPRIRSWLALAAAGATLTACSASAPPAAVRGSLTAIGSGVQGNAISAWRSGWVKEHRETSLNFSPDGSDVGVQALLDGQAHFAATDAPLSADEVGQSRNACGPDGAFSVPVAVIPVGVAYNLPGVKNLRLDPAVLAGIFSGRITDWNAPELSRLNPDLDLPAEAINPLRAEEESELTAVVTGYLADGGWDAPAAAAWPAEIAGETVKRYADLANKIDDTGGSIAFLDKASIGSRFEPAQLRFGNDFVRLNDETVALAAEGGTAGSGPGGSVVFATDTDSGEGYGLAAVSYQSFCTSYKNGPLTALVRSWAEYVVSDSGQSNSTYYAGVDSPSTAALELSRERVAEIEERR